MRGSKGESCKVVFAKTDKSKSRSCKYEIISEILQEKLMYYDLDQIQSEAFPLLHQATSL
jgi:hypothetical protein